MKNDADKYIKIGTIIKSFDFPSRQDCFKIGKITAIDKEMNLYSCDEVYSVWLNERIENYGLEQQFETAINDIFDDMYVDGRIQILEI